MIGFQAAYGRRGIKLELGERLALGFQFHLAKSREDGMREAAQYYEDNMKMFGELRLVGALSKRVNISSVLAGQPSASRRSTTAFGSSASCTTISASSISNRKPCNPSTTPSAKGCHPMS